MSGRPVVPAKVEESALPWAQIPSLFISGCEARLKPVNFLTKQQQVVLCVVVVLLLTGLAVKIYRTSRPPVRLTPAVSP
jgi:hypothetical protein